MIRPELGSRIHCRGRTYEPPRPAGAMTLEHVMTDRHVLYLGDTALTGAACYLTGLMTHWGWRYRYVPSNVALDGTVLEGDGDQPGLIVLSDYPSKNIKPSTQERVVEWVGHGVGLLMIGGWESFCGHGGNWAGTPVGQILPVQVSESDDRVNCDHPALLGCRGDHPVTDGLPWSTRPPTVGGFNRFEPKPEAQVLLDVHQFEACRRDAGFEFREVRRDPMLVVGEHSQGGATSIGTSGGGGTSGGYSGGIPGVGRVAALATDVAPHWVGGLVDWGNSRVTAQAPGGVRDRGRRPVCPFPAPAARLGGSL